MTADLEKCHGCRAMIPARPHTVSVVVQRYCSASCAMRNGAIAQNKRPRHKCQHCGKGVADTGMAQHMAHAHRHLVEVANEAVRSVKRDPLSPTPVDDDDEDFDVIERD